MAEISREPKVSLRLIIDEEKNKVVWAEAGRDFVEVLLSFMTLPMGTIVRLLTEKVTIGCFSNLYKSVVDMEVDDFVTEACKQMLVYPRSVGEAWCRTLKLNINPTEASKFFVCSSLSHKTCRKFSNFSTSLCTCKQPMNMEMGCVGADQVTGGMNNDISGLFTRERSSFIITDDLKLRVNSASSLLQTLQDLGYADVGKLRERALDVGLEEGVTLLQCVFSSNATLTDTFLKNQSPHKVKKIYGTTSSRLEQEKEKGDEAGPDKVITFDAFVRKQDMKIMFVECDYDFVDLLFTFLAIPLESIWEISKKDITLGCVGNLCKIFKDLSGSERSQRSSSSSSSASKCVPPYYYSFTKQLVNYLSGSERSQRSSASKCVLPYYYSCTRQLLNIDTPKPPRVIYSYLKEEICLRYVNSSSDLDMTGPYPAIVKPGMNFVDPKSDLSYNLKEASDEFWTSCRDVSLVRKDGFVKRERKFTVSDDLIVTPKKSNLSLLKELESKADDLEAQVISISSAEAVNLLRASLVTSSALSSAFKSLIKCKAKEERWNPILKKPKIETLILDP